MVESNASGLLKGVLSGIRIIEGSAYIAAPMGGMMLVQMGAEVIRFDPPHGGIDYGRWPLSASGKSLYWHGLNKGKKSVCIDIRHPEGQELLSAMVTAPGEGAGLLLTNFPLKGKMAYSQLQSQRQDVIICQITGNYDATNAVDSTVNASIGIPFITGPSDHGRPVNHALPAWDLLTAAHASTAMLAALHHRQQSGKGQHITLALSDVALSAVAGLGYVAEVQINGEDRQAKGNDIYGAFGRDFKTADGRRIMVVTMTARHWHALLQATGLAEAMGKLELALSMNFSEEGDRFRARDAIALLLEPWISSRNLSDIGPCFDQYGVLWGPYQTFRQLVEEDKRCSTDNPLFALLHQQDIGTYLMSGSPIAFSEPGRLPPTPAPRLGEHTDEVLSNILGLSAVEIGQLHDKKVIFTAQ
ncbi:MAG: CoA transferase [Alphaproteobacteria bacterium]